MQERRLRVAGAEIDLGAREVILAEGAVRLEPRAAAVLAALAAADGRVLSREDLLDQCWPPGEGSDEALTQAVAQVRRALGDDPRRPRFVGTVHRGGYRWMARPAPLANLSPPVLPSPARNWRRAAALSALVLLGAVAGAGVLKAAIPPERRMQIKTEDVVTVNGETVRTIREYNGTPAEVRAAMARHRSP